ncbi:hypothetical protein QAD02_014931 [Eretmocerus hayati]|uniref:Uncharacterized protein n=1 Tax=Eretmocerus hayati TaxID=131215 RepID=A0ACC2P960_9HYME|nr:hypothetical protein QAD02_014931 [Eretmocerus hayati]
MSAPHKMVLIVRMDLNMSQGKIASQCAHAALACYLRGTRSIFNYFLTKEWLLLGQAKVVLKVNSETELVSLAEKAERAGLITCPVMDAGRTQVGMGTVTVLGIGPAPSSKIDTVTSHLRLL